MMMRGGKPGMGQRPGMGMPGMQGMQGMQGMMPGMQGMMRQMMPGTYQNPIIPTLPHNDMVVPGQPWNGPNTQWGGEIPPQFMGGFFA